MKFAEEKTNVIRWQTVDHLDIALSIKRDVFFLLSYREKFLSSRRVAWDKLAMQNFFLVFNNCQQCWLNLLLWCSCSTVDIFTHEGRSYVRGGQWTRNWCRRCWRWYGKINNCYNTDDNGNDNDNNIALKEIEKKSKFKDLGLETYILWQMVENIKKV